MDEFERNLKYHKIDPWDNFQIPKKWGRRSSRKKLKYLVQDEYSEYLFWSNYQPDNIWDEPEFDENGKFIDY